MTDSYLEVTFRRGRAMAAYLYLPRRPDERSVRTSQAGPGLVVDFNRSGKPIGVEIVSPAKLTITALNKVLRDLGVPPMKRSDLAPLRAA